MNRMVFDLVLLLLVGFLFYKLWNINNNDRSTKEQKFSLGSTGNEIVISDIEFAEFREMYQRLMMSYAVGDLDSLRELLSDDGYDKFSVAIENRQARSEIAHCDEINIIHMDLTKSIDSDSDLAIVVKSEQIAYVLNESGNVISGSKERRYSVDCMKLRKNGSSWRVVSIERK